ncbi:response regulator transcription factor [Candidatus Mycolicibacterium alkanivorans]|uniref:Helix-turn-helix transcriptional regulator n=1 Tax=Candidatus Mycolicibacterium alkanivorans TaxID=2954114 RepID=A0ABS9YVU0_9MYCO|nr:helix-turn-helix transcriptional regulator [Candidatus Mycolicibacterium alkanivorans]MCI4675335.1 helix-turn-helix transcriptional regulator [Candidatus Mycolicibacterium alkanivorans]
MSGTATPLTAREQDVLAFLRTPMTAAEIASRFSVSVNTVKTHQRAIYRKLGVANRREAIRAVGPTGHRGDTT